jgi:5'-3' exonuclease
VQAICGDTSDKIPGVKGIGIKGAVGLVKTFGTPEGMAQGLVAEQNACKMKGKDLSAFWRNFAVGMVDIPKWIALTTLRTDVEFDVHPLKFLDYVAPQRLDKPLPPAPSWCRRTSRSPGRWRPRGRRRGSCVASRPPTGG